MTDYSSDKSNNIQMTLSTPLDKVNDHTTTFDWQNFFSNIYYQNVYTCPKKYIQVYINTHEIKFQLIDNRHILETFTFETAKHDQTEFSEFLSRKKDIPLHILIDSDDVEFQTISLENKNIIYRQFLIFKIKKTEIESKEWTYVNNTGVINNQHKYQLISFSPSTALMQNLIFIKQSQNPIFKVQLYSIAYLHAALERLRDHDNINVAQDYEWSIFVKKNTNNTWMITSQNYQNILITRSGALCKTEKDDETTSNFAKEIMSSIKYLYRFGFNDKSTLHIICTGFDHENLETDLNNQHIQSFKILSIPSRDLDQRLIFSPIHFLKDFWNAICLKNKKNTITELSAHHDLSSMFFKTQKIFFYVPQKIFRIATPILTFLFFLNVLIMINIMSSQFEINNSENYIKTLSTKFSDKNRCLEASLFDTYTDFLPDSPLPFLRYFKRIITKKCHIISYVWENSPNDQSTSFKAMLKLPPRLIKQRKKILPNSLKEQYLQIISSHIKEQFDVDISFNSALPQAPNKVETSSQNNQQNDIYQIKVNWKNKKHMGKS